ncbi:MAG: hypothetical protein ACREB0_07540, partial [Sphingopyxis sp.]
AERTARTAERGGAARMRETLRLKKPPADPGAVDREIASLLRAQDDEEHAIAVALMAMADDDENPRSGDRGRPALALSKPLR